MSGQGPELAFRALLDGTENDVLDVGSGHGGAFDFGRWNERAKGHRVVSDVHYLRPDVRQARGWDGLIADGAAMPFVDGSFDVVQCGETLEHVPSDRWDVFMAELERLARRLVYVTTTDETQHTGPEQLQWEERNPYTRYLGSPPRSFFEGRGYFILVDNGHNIQAYKRF